MDEFFAGMDSDYREGLKVLKSMRAKYIGQLRGARKNRDVKRQDNIERIIATINEEISETVECIGAIGNYRKRREGAGKIT